MKEVLLYCRPGFERECAQDMVERSVSCGATGESRTTDGSGFVVFAAAGRQHAEMLRRQLRFDELIFARQIIFVAQLIEGLTPADRLRPLLDALKRHEVRCAEVFVEHADTDQGKQLSSFCRKFSRVLQASMAEADMLSADAPHRLHLFFLDSSRCYLGFSIIGNASAWPLGIPRIRFPAGAPSRSALKLAEAFVTFLTPEEQSVRLAAGMRAVDLGASPGGWSWQLAYRGLHVTAVDNGPLARGVIDTGFVEHLRVDGFHYRPKRAVDWMVCDMVEKPARVAALVAQWAGERWCRHCIFNLKLPMKKRYAELQKCAALIGGALDINGSAYRLRFKQLYHDREEVTGYLFASDGPRRKR